MAMGLLEAFDLIHRFGRNVLSVDEILFSAAAFNRKGCKMVSSKLTREDIDKVLEMGKRIKNWKEGGK